MFAYLAVSRSCPTDVSLNLACISLRPAAAASCAIAKWFEDHDTDLETGAKLESKMLIPNRRLKSLIREFQEAQAAAAAAQEAQIARALRPQLRPCHCLSSHSAEGPRAGAAVVDGVDVAGVDWCTTRQIEKP